MAGPRSDMADGDDEFELGERLGGGASGEVVRALWRPRGLEVALKVLRRGVTPGSPEHVRFLREAVVARVRSPYVVQVHEARAGDPTFLVLEYVPGGTLRERLQRGPLSLPDALEVAEHVARGLQAAAAAGVVHRDVKPSNVLLPPGGPARLCDFGIAKDLDGAIEHLTASGVGLGTLAYLAPEQLDAARHVDPNADVYGLGATLFHALAGRPPFDVSSPESLLAIVEGRPPSLLELRAGCPLRVAALVEEMLAKRPGERPPAWEVVERLSQLRRS